MATSRPKLPSGLAKLPTMNFVRSPAPSAASHERADIVYEVRSAKTLVNEYEKRESRIRGLVPGTKASG